MSQSQNPVGFGTGFAVSQPTACETAFSKGCIPKTEVLGMPHIKIRKKNKIPLDVIDNPGYYIRNRN
jgi:hypothetical protein